MIDIEKRIELATLLEDRLATLSCEAGILKAELLNGGEVRHYREYVQVMLSELADLTDKITDQITTEIVARHPTLDLFNGNGGTDT